MAREDGINEYLVGVRLRVAAPADDYRVGDLELHVGDLVLVETAAGGTGVT